MYRIADQVKFGLIWLCTPFSVVTSDIISQIQKWDNCSMVVSFIIIIDQTVFPPAKVMAYFHSDASLTRKSA